MRLYLVPKVKKGVAARPPIRSGHERRGLRTEAEGEVAEYERALAAVKAEATARIEVASRQLEANARSVSPASPRPSPSAAAAAARL